MLAESANLLMMPGRARDQKQWMADAKLMLDAGAAAVKAAKAKNVEAISALSDQLMESCTSCHRHYRPGYGQAETAADRLARLAAADRGRHPDRGAGLARAAASPIVLYTSKEQIPLKAYAEMMRAGILQIVSGSAKDIPTVTDVSYFRCA